MKSKLTYRHTTFVCYFANFFQAIGTIFPLLLVPLRTVCGLSYTQFGVLVALNFCTQVLSDILFSKPVDRYGFRRFAVGAPIVGSVGLVLFAAAPVLFPSEPFIGFCCGTVLFAAAGGLQELLLSPIVDALPAPDSQRAKNMSLLHSFFAWGQIFVILLTTALLAVWGAEGWQRIVLLWAAVPLISAAMFTSVPLVQRVSHHDATPIRKLLCDRVFLLAVAAIICGGAAEVTMGQWASAFIENGLLLPKAVGDLLGVCGFSLMLAMGRTAYGIWGERISIHKLMLAGSICAAGLYLLLAFSSSPVVGLAACAVTGLCTSLLWPGCISVASRSLPAAGASLFALMSAAGDVGASAGAFAVGRVADAVSAAPPAWLSGIALSGEQLGLRCGMLVAAIFPLICFVVNLALRRTVMNKDRSQAR